MLRAKNDGLSGVYYFFRNVVGQIGPDIRSRAQDCSNRIGALQNGA